MFTICINITCGYDLPKEKKIIIVLSCHNNGTFIFTSRHVWSCLHSSVTHHFRFPHQLKCPACKTEQCDVFRNMAPMASWKWVFRYHTHGHKRTRVYTLNRAAAVGCARVINFKKLGICKTFPIGYLGSIKSPCSVSLGSAAVLTLVNQPWIGQTSLVSYSFLMCLEI